MKTTKIKILVVVIFLYGCSSKVPKEKGKESEYVSRTEMYKDNDFEICKIKEYFDASCDKDKIWFKMNGINFHDFEDWNCDVQSSSFVVQKSTSLSRLERPYYILSNNRLLVSLFAESSEMLMIFYLAEGNWKLKQSVSHIGLPIIKDNTIFLLKSINVDSATVKRIVLEDSLTSFSMNLKSDIEEYFYVDEEIPNFNTQW